jgi:hypothetical protein
MATAPGWAVPSLFCRSQRRRTMICASGVRAHPRRVCAGDFSLFANSSRAERPAGSPTGIDSFEPPTGRTAGSTANEGPAHACSGVEGSGESPEDRLLSCFSAIGPKAINLADTPAAGVCNPGLYSESHGTPPRTPGCVEQQGLRPPVTSVMGQAGMQLNPVMKSTYGDS